MTYKSSFEFLKEKSNKLYYSRKLDNCKQNIKKTWDTVIGKTKTLKNDIPKRIALDGIENFDQNKISNRFDKYFAEITPKLASSITISSKDFKQFMVVLETVLQEYTLQDEQLEEVFNSLKSNKSPGLDDIPSPIINFCISDAFHPVNRIFNLSLQTGIFPNGMKTAQLSPIFLKKMRNFFLLITDQYQYFNVSPNSRRGDVR